MTQFHHGSVFANIREIRIDGHEFVGADRRPMAHVLQKLPIDVLGYRSAGPGRVDGGINRLSLSGSKS